MAVTLDVPPGVLEAAGRAWDDAHDKLAGAVARLDSTVLGELSSGVTTAARAFLEVWSGEVAVLSRQSESSAEAFADLDADLEINDAAGALRLRSLLPWVHHAAAVREA